MNNGMSVPFRNGYHGPGTDSFSHPRPPTRGGGGGGGSYGPGPGPTSSSLPPPPPPFPYPPEKSRQRRSSAGSTITPSNTPTNNPGQIPNNRSSLPSFSSSSSSAVRNYTSNHSNNPYPNNRNSNDNFSFPPPRHQNAPFNNNIPQPQPPKRSSSSTSNPNPNRNSRPQPPPPLPSLPPTIDEDDPMLDYAPETWIASMIGTSGLLYRFSESLVYKSNVSPREALLMESAGNLTLRPLTRVIWKENPNYRSPLNNNINIPPGVGVPGRTKAVIMEFGKRFRPSDIPPQRLRNVVIDMFMLVQTLHGQCGIVHGDIKPSNFLWGRDGRLKLADFSSARFIEEDPELWNDRNVTEVYLTPERMRVREENGASSESVKGNGNGNRNGENGNGKTVGPPAQAQGRTPAPTVFDDYYALGITLWSIFTGKRPVNHQFNQRNIRRSDLVEVQDDLVRRWIRKVFKMAGCRFW